MREEEFGKARVNESWWGCWRFFSYGEMTSLRLRRMWGPCRLAGIKQTLLIGTMAFWAKSYWTMDSPTNWLCGGLSNRFSLVSKKLLSHEFCTVGLWGQAWSTRFFFSFFGVPPALFCILFFSGCLYLVVSLTRENINYSEYSSRVKVFWKLVGSNLFIFKWWGVFRTQVCMVHHKAC